MVGAVARAGRLDYRPREKPGEFESRSQKRKGIRQLGSAIKKSFAGLHALNTARRRTWRGQAVPEIEIQVAGFAGDRRVVHQRNQPGCSMFRVARNITRPVIIIACIGNGNKHLERSHHLMEHVAYVVYNVGILRHIGIRSAAWPGKKEEQPGRRFRHPDIQ